MLTRAASVVEAVVTDPEHYGPAPSVHIMANVRGWRRKEPCLTPKQTMINGLAERKRRKKRMAVLHKRASKSLARHSPVPGPLRLQGSMAESAAAAARPVPPGFNSDGLCAL